ncbi:MAG: hypothetical protein ACTTHM_11075 [Peptoanaerobacter stomatis]|uniref:hypothetical protein n=1 Tax=Peptoanaerobacter stomatis TaxID=796937 RepID=UPI003FA0CF3A
MILAKVRVLVRLRDNKYIGYYILEDKEIINQQELEELEHKDGFYNETYYDESTCKLKQRYIEIPKSKEQLLEEEIEKIKRAIADEGEPDLSELGSLSNNVKANKKKDEAVPDLSELDNI